jgi:hypothetical protein
MTTFDKLLSACRGQRYAVFIIFDFFRNANYHGAIVLTGANIASRGETQFLSRNFYKIWQPLVQNMLSMER